MFIVDLTLKNKKKMSGIHPDTLTAPLIILSLMYFKLSMVIAIVYLLIKD